MPEEHANRPENKPMPAQNSAAQKPPPTSPQSSNQMSNQVSRPGEQVRRQGQEAVEQITEKGQQAASSIGEQVRYQVTSQAQSQKEKATEGLGGVALALRQTGQHLREQGQEPLAGLAETGAEQVEHLTGYFRHRDLDQITSDVESFARRQPTLFLGAAFGLGFLASRFLKSSGQLPLASQPDSGPAAVEQSVEVSVPLQVAYGQWTQFEEFPQFMEGVEQVRQLDDKRLHWKAEIAGKTEEWDAVISEQQPDRVVAWRSTSGAQNTGRVTFAPVNSTTTRVTLRLEYQPEGIVENVGSALGFVERRVQGDLQRFKQFIESRGAATGAWRGEIKRETVTRPD